MSRSSVHHFYPSIHPSIYLSTNRSINTSVRPSTFKSTIPSPQVLAKNFGFYSCVTWFYFIVERVIVTATKQYQNWLLKQQRTHVAQTCMLMSAHRECDSVTVSYVIITCSIPKLSCSQAERNAFVCFRSRDGLGSLRRRMAVSKIYIHTYMYMYM